jgi:hypothetical protein
MLGTQQSLFDRVATCTLHRVRDDELLERMRRTDYSKMHFLINKPPRWNDQVTSG